MSLVRRLAVRSAVAVSVAGLAFLGLGPVAASAATAAQHTVTRTTAKPDTSVWEYSGESFPTEQECIDVGYAAVNDSDNGIVGFRCPSDGPTFDLWLLVSNSCPGGAPLSLAVAPAAKAHLGPAAC